VASSVEGKSCRHGECGENETFPMEVTPVQLDETQLITLELESDNYIQFQADIAQCNVIPLDYSVPISCYASTDSYHSIWWPLDTSCKYNSAKGLARLLSLQTKTVKEYDHH